MSVTSEAVKYSAKATRKFRKIPRGRKSGLPVPWGVKEARRKRGAAIIQRMKDNMKGKAKGRARRHKNLLKISKYDKPQTTPKQLRKQVVAESN